jgi:hypothetical protein
MTDEQKTKFVALQDAWLAVLEKYRQAESVPERDAVITEFVKRHITETDTAVLEAFQHWRSTASPTSLGGPMAIQPAAKAPMRTATLGHSKQSRISSQSRARISLAFLPATPLTYAAQCRT